MTPTTKTPEQRVAELEAALTGLFNATYNDNKLWEVSEKWSSVGATATIDNMTQGLNQSTRESMRRAYKVLHNLPCPA